MMYVHISRIPSFIFFLLKLPSKQKQLNKVTWENIRIVFFYAQNLGWEMVPQSKEWKIFGLYKYLERDLYLPYPRKLVGARTCNISDTRIYHSSLDQLKYQNSFDIITEEIFFILEKLGWPFLKCYLIMLDTPLILKATLTFLGKLSVITINSPP